MRPLDPRLLRHARAARPYVALTAGLGCLTAVLVVLQALLLARIIAGLAESRDDLSSVVPALSWLAAAVGARAVVAAAQERYGHRAATAVIGQLRAAVISHTVRLGPAGTGAAASVATLVNRGLDALDGYLTRYLPQLLLAATVSPAVLAVIWWHDTLAGLTVALTLPLIPVFMALVGLAAQDNADRRLRTLQRLGAQTLDLLAGLPTLRALGREHGQAAQVRAAGDAYRRATMRTLRSAFLSSLVLETLATLSVALVAVGVGLRLVHGGLDLRTGLVVLILTPEVYLPLRLVGLHYHASVDGLAAAKASFEILERAPREHGHCPAPDLAVSTIRIEGLTVVHPGAAQPTPDSLDVVLRPGEIVALTGRSGCGKSTVVGALLGLCEPTAGRILVETGEGSVDLRDIDPAGWTAQVSWVPQRAAIVPGTVAENARLTAPAATDAELTAAATRTGLDRVVAELPHGWSTRLGEGGHGLSAGQRQRLALTRALLRDAPLVLLDEPTAHLDSSAELAVHETLRALRGAGRTVLLVAHRPALTAVADRTVSVDALAATR